MKIDNKKEIIFYLSLIIISLIVFILVAINYGKNELLNEIDKTMIKLLYLYQEGILINIMVWITRIADPISLTILTICLFIYLLIKKEKISATIVAFSTVIAISSEWLLKIGFGRARPLAGIISVTGYSFPSAHATLSLLFFSLVIYSFKEQIKNRFYRILFIAANILLILLIGMSRVYLNVHYFSDVIGGFALGLFWLSISIMTFDLIIYKRHKKARFGRA